MEEWLECFLTPPPKTTNYLLVINALFITGDVIKMTLDCDHNVMHFWINDEPLTSLPTLPGPLWPWGNGYVRGMCSLAVCLSLI